MCEKYAYEVSWLSIRKLTVDLGFVIIYELNIFMYIDPPTVQFTAKLGDK